MDRTVMIDWYNWRMGSNYATCIFTSALTVGMRVMRGPIKDHIKSVAYTSLFTELTYTGNNMTWHLADTDSNCRSWSIDTAGVSLRDYH